MSNSNLGLYLHVPFCASRCPYCSFFTKRPEGSERDLYVNALKWDLTARSAFLHAKVDTVYFGGGTPSVLPGQDIADLLQTIEGIFYLVPAPGMDAPEITVECNPSSDLESFLPVVAEAGVNRISLGLQSAVDAERKALGRKADAERVKDCIALAQANGITNLSLDVMLGVPGQTAESLARTLDFCAESGATHVSAYILKLEEGTVFWKRQDQLNLPDEDTVAALYTQTCDTLESYGFRQYEISNFAKPGYESRHNLKYWHCEDYMGFGPSAHSFIDGGRFYYPADLEAYLAEKARLVHDGPGGSPGERLMLALRLTEGYTGPLSDAVLSRAREPQLQPFVKLEPAGPEGWHLSLTRDGFLVSNAVLAELLKDIDI